VGHIDEQSKRPLLSGHNQDKSWSLTTEWLKVWISLSPKGNPPAQTGDS
jgi:hypothetical protein